MKKYRIIRYVTEAHGTQEFEVYADNGDSAFEKFKNGEGELVDSEVEVIALGEDSLNDVYLVE